MQTIPACAVCGAPFAATPNNLSRKRFCSERCRERTRPPKQRPPQTCPVCLMVFRGQGVHQRTCSVRCSNMERYVGASCPIVMHRCICGAWYVKRPKAWHCRVQDGRVMPRGAYVPVVPRPLECRRCGETFIGSHTYLCRACAKASKAINHRTAKRRRKARVRSGHVAYRDADIHQRDGWRCHICKRVVKRGAVVPHPLAPTIDHLIPLSAGGRDAPDNVACAHFRCNSLRGAGGTVQLLLVA